MNNNNIYNNFINNNSGILSICGMIASFIVEKYFVIIGIVIGLSILNDFIRIATDAAFYIYDYFTDPLILRQR